MIIDGPAHVVLCWGIFWRAAACKTTKKKKKPEAGAKTRQKNWQLKKRRKMCCRLMHEAITQSFSLKNEWLCTTSGYSSTPDWSFLFFLHFWRREVSQAPWPLTLCVRRETCVSLWLPLWQTEECMSFTVLENRLRQPHLYSLPPTLTPRPSLLLRLL